MDLTLSKGKPPPSVLVWRLLIIATITKTAVKSTSYARTEERLGPKRHT